MIEIYNRKYKLSEIYNKKGIFLDVFTAISDRRSIRKYKSNEIEEEKLEKILESTRIAPSAANRQEWKFMVVRKKETREKLVEAVNGQKFVGEAPVTTSLFNRI